MNTKNRYSGVWRRYWMEIFSIILGILEFLTYLFEKVGISQLGTFLSSFCFGLSDYFNSHQIMFSVCSLGSLLATIIFCRKELRNLPSYISKVIRYPSTNPEILEKRRRYYVQKYEYKWKGAFYFCDGYDNPCFNSDFLYFAWQRFFLRSG